MASAHAVACALAFAIACADPNEPDDWNRAPARLFPAMSSVQAVAAPPEVRVGEPFMVTITSLGSSSCRRADVTDISSSGAVIDLRPWDRVAPPGPCTDDLHSFPHAVTLTATAAGALTIRVHAVLVDPSLAEREGTIELVVQAR